MKEIIAHVNGFCRLDHFSYSLNKRLEQTRTTLRDWSFLCGGQETIL